MINLPGISPLSLLAPDGAETSAPTVPDQTTAFLEILKEQVSLVTNQSPATGPEFVSQRTAAASSDSGRAASLNSLANTSVANGAAGPTPMKNALRFVMEHEGKAYVSNDAGKESSKYGILQNTAARYGYSGQIRNMSQSDAEAVYQKIWEESGARDLPPSLALVHFDTYINSPQAAKKMLQSSGGDVNAYLRLRSQRYARLSALKPTRYGQYMNGWMKRIQDLRTATAHIGPSTISSSV